MAILSDDDFKNLFENKGGAGIADMPELPQDKQPTPDVPDLPSPGGPKADKSKAKPAPKGVLADEDFDKLFGKKAQPVAGGSTGARQGYNPEEFDFQPKLGQNNEQLRAQQQGTLAQVGKTIGNTVANVPLDMLQAVGYTGQLLSSDHTYDNGLIDVADKLKDPFGAVYRENPDKTFDLADPAWWLNNAGGFVEGTAQFLIPGEAEAAGIGDAVKAVSAGLKLGKGASEAMLGAGQVLSSAHLAYLMAASSGRQMYKDSYDTNYHRLLNQGYDPDSADEQAKKISSDAAATTVQLSTALNTVFGLAALAPMFRTNENKIMQWLETKGSRQEGESLQGWKARLNEAGVNDEDLQKAMQSRPGGIMAGYPAQALQIGIQGVNTEYAEKKGREVAAGTAASNVDAISDYFDKVTDQEGALNFLTGVIGGPVHALLMDNVPIHRVIRYDDTGKPILKADPKIVQAPGKEPQYETERVSARTQNELGNRVFFDNMKDAINKDVDWYSKKQDDLKTALAKNDHMQAEMIRQEMFSVNNLNAVSMGLGDNWKKEYQGIASLDNKKDLGQAMQPQVDALQQQVQEATQGGQDPAPLQQQLDQLKTQQQALVGKTEAMQAGYSRGLEDNDYKDRATRAVGNLDWMKKTYDNTRNRYVSMSNPNSEELAYHIFAKEAESHLMRQTLDDERASITRDQGIVDPIQTYNEQAKVSDAAAKSLNEDRQAMLKMMENNDINGLRQMAGKYRVPSYDDHFIMKGVEETIASMQKEIDQHNEDSKTALQSLHDDSGFTNWQKTNAGKGFNDYLKDITDRQPIDDRITERKANLEKMESQWRVRRDNLDKVKSSRGIEEFYRNAKADMDGWKKDHEMQNMKDNVDAFMKQQDMVAAERLKRQSLEGEQGEIRQRMLRSLEEENKLKERIQDLREKLSKLKPTEGEKILAHRGLLRRAEMDLSNLQKTRSADSERAQQLSDAIQESARKEETNASLTRDQVQEQAANPNDTVQAEPSVSLPPAILPESEPAATTDTEPAQENDPVKDYLGLKDQLSDMGRIRDAVENLELMQNPENYSFDLARAALEPFVEDGTINEDVAHSIMLSQKSYLESNQGQIDHFKALMDGQPLIPTPLPPEVPSPIPGLTTDDVTGPEEPFSLVLNLSPNAMATPEESMQIDTHVGAKVISSMKINVAAIQYMEVVKHGKGGTYHAFLPLYDKLDPAFNRNILKPDFISEGDSVRFEVDTNWKGKINYDRSLENNDYGDPMKKEDSFSNYTEDGKIRMQGEGYSYENVPIRIIHEKSGEMIGYLPRTDWVTASYAASGYRNMVDNYTDSEGNEIENNVEAQKQKLLTVRRIISLAHNEDSEPIKSQISPRDSGGHPFYSTSVNKNTETSKLTPKLAKTLLPDKSLKFGILNGGTVFTGHATPLEGPKNFTEQDMSRYGKPGVKEANNVPMVILPMPNGKASVSPLYTRQLSERPADIHTIARAIEAHLAGKAGNLTAQHQKWIDAIKRATTADGNGKPLDITNPRDLESFVNQYYTYTQHFREADTAMDARVMENKTKTPRFMLDIEKDGPAPGIKIGTSWSGEKPIAATLGADGKLDPRFEEALTNGLGQHYKNVVFTRGDLRGINDDKPFHSITIKRDGNTRVDKHDNYNEYLKTFAETFVYGHHQAADGTYLYGANPVTNFDFDPVINSRVEAEQPGEGISGDEENIFDSLINGNPTGPDPNLNTKENPKPPVMKTLDDVLQTKNPKDVSIASITSNVHALYDEASAHPDQQFHLDLPGDPKAKIKLGDKSSITMTNLAAIIDSKPIPYNLKLSDDFMSILQNTPRRFLNNLMYEDHSLFDPLPYDEEILGKQISEMFVPVRDENGQQTGVFEAEKQSEVTDNIVHGIKVMLDLGIKTSVQGYQDRIKNDVFKMMRDKYDKVSTGGKVKGMDDVTVDQALNLRNEYDKILRSFNSDGLNFWTLALDKLRALGINTRDNRGMQESAEQLKLTADGTDPLEGATFQESEGHGLVDWSDVSFQTDPKDTATARMKMFLATIPDSKVGDEEQPKEINLSFSDPRVRTKITQGVKTLTTRTQEQAEAMGLKLGQDVTTRIDGKLMRVTPIRVMNENDAIAHENIGEEEGTKPSPGDMLIKMEPYLAKQNVLTSNKNYLGLSKLADYEDLFEKTLATLANQPKDFQQYLQLLRDAGNQYNPNLRALADRLDKAPTEVQNEFTSVVSLQYQPFSMVLLDSRRDSTGKSYNVLRTISANRGSQVGTLVETWQQNQKFASILKRNEAGITVVDPMRAQELKSELTRVNGLYMKGDAGAQQAATDLMKKVFDYNGITMPDRAIQSLIDQTQRWTKKTSLSGDFRRQFAIAEDGKPMGIISTMIQKLSGKTSENDDDDAMEDKSFQMTNPLYTEKNTINILARVAAAHSAQLFSNTHRSSEGKSIYDYGFNNTLSRSVQRITSDPVFRDKFKDVDIARKSWLLDKLNNDPQLRSRFQISYLDGLKVAYMPSASGVVRPEMSDREQLLTSLGLFINGGDPQYAHYLSLTHSDKSTTPVFNNAPRIREVTISGLVPDKITGNPRTVFRIGEEAINRLHDVFHSEYDRIQKASQVGDYNNPKYEKGASHFYFLPQMNYEDMKTAAAEGKVPQKVFEKIWVAGKEQLNVKEAPGFKEAVQFMLTRHIDDMTNNTLHEWQKNGIVTDGDAPLDRKYMNRLLTAVGIRWLKPERADMAGTYVDRAGQVYDEKSVHNLSAQLAARDYATNHYLMNVSMSQIFYGDPAQVWKGSVDKTMIEYGKRLAKDIAPGRELGFKPGETFTTITAKDFKTSAPYLSEIESLKKAYTDGHPLESTDAQELTTVKEHLDVLRAAGRISDKVYTDMTKIITNAKGGYYEFTDPHHREVIMQPQKPVYVGDRPPANGALLNDYIKSSSYPLYPPFLAGKELDRVRVAMEQGSIARLNFESAHKIGVPTSPVDLFDNNGKVRDDAFTTPSWIGKDAKGNVVPSARQEMSRDNFRIQQEVPYDEDKDHIRTVSQMNKLITQGLPLITRPFSFEGRQVSARELIDTKEQIRKDLFDLNQRELMPEIGAEMQDGKMVVTDRNKLFDTLQKRALEGNLGFTANDVAYLKESNRLPNTDQLVIPLMYSPSASKFESMLMSMVSDIANVKMPGKSYIQASPAGQQGVRDWESLPEAQKKNIVWVGNYDGSALKTVRPGEADGALQPAQVIAPWRFKGKLEDFIIKDDDGRQTIDPTRVPPELLQMVGARIPNQGHNSMLPIEIVGFTPDNMGDLVIVPAAITKQMGSDFDVDKLYTYQRAYQDKIHVLPKDATEEEITASKLPAYEQSAEEGDVLKNRYFDMHWSVLTHPDMLSNILNPLDKNDLKDEAALISKWEDKYAGTKPTYYDPQYQLRDFQAQKDAKRLVGLSSLSTTFNAVIQDKNIRPGTSVMGDDFQLHDEVIPVHIIDGSGKLRRLSTLSGYGQSVYTDGVEKDTAGQLRSKHDNHTTVQSEVLDYAKNKISDKVHLSTYTYPASAALTQLQEPDGSGSKADSKLIGDSRGWAAHLGFNARLLSQPIIQDFVSEMAKRGDSLSGEFSADLKNHVADAIAEQYRATAVAAGEDDLKDDHVVSYGDLTDGLARPSSVDNFNHKQIAALNLFMQLDQIGQAMMKAQSTINHDTNGAGSTMLDILSKEITKERVKSGIGKNDGDISLLGAESLYTRPDGQSTEQGKLYDMIHGAADAVVGSQFPYRTMMPLFQYIMEHTNRQDLSIDTQQNVFNSVKSYLFTHPQLGFWANPEVTRANLLYRREGNPSLADRVHEAKGTWGQNNYFLQRLQVDVDPDNLHPSHVSYQASKASRLDDYENTKSWLDMFLSPKPEARKLAEDLVRYSYLTGGNQDARSFVKYIPYSYLVGTDFGHKLRELTGNLNDLIRDNPNFKEQWFQHNPQFAKSLSTKMTELGSEVEKYPERFSLQPINRENPYIDNPAKDLIVRTKGESNIMTPGYPDYLSYRSKEENRWILFKRTDSSDYTRIDTLGDKNMDEYSVGEGAKRSLIPENRSRAYDNIEPAFRMVNGAPMIPTGDKIMKELNIPKTGGYKEMIDVLKGFSGDRSLPMHTRIVADMLSKMTEEGPNRDVLTRLIATQQAPAFRFETDKYDMGGAAVGSMDSTRNVMTLNSAKLTDKALTADTVNHEMIHSHTALLTMFAEDDKWLKARGYKDDQIHFFRNIWSEISDKHPEVKAAIDELEKVRKEAIGHLKDFMEQKGMDFEKRYEAVIKYGDVQTETDRVLYSLASKTELVTGAMTDPPTMRFLNSRPYSKSEMSFVNRIIDSIKQIMSSIAKSFGFPISRGSLLEASITQTMRLMTTGRNSFDLTPDKLHDVNNMNLTSNSPLTTATMGGLDRIIGKLEEQKEELVNSLTGRLAKEDVADKRSKIDDITNDIDKLQKELSTDLVAAIGAKHLGWVESVTRMDKPSDSQIMTSSRVLEVWTNLVDLLYGDSGAKVDPAFSQLYSDAQSLRSALTMKMKETMVNTSDNVVGMKDFSSTNLVDIDRAQALVRGLSSAATSRVSQYIATYMETVARHRDEDVVRNVNRMQDLEERMAGIAGGKKNLPGFYEKFFQDNADHSAWGLVQRFHQNWYDFRKETGVKRDTALKAAGIDPLKDPATASKEKQKIWQSYWKTMNDSAIFADTRLLFDEKGEDKTDTNATRHRGELETTLGKNTADELIGEARDRYKMYLDHKEAHFTALDGEVDAGERPAEEADRLKDEFVARYSPNAFFNAFRNPLATFKGVNSDYYVKMAPRHTEGDDHFYDKKFDDIQKDPKVKGVYDEINHTLQTLKEALPVHVQQELGKNFMPVLAKSLFTDMIDVPGYITHMGEKAVNDLTASANEELEADKSHNKIPLRYITDDRKNLPLEMRSRDIPRMLETFGMMALHYKHFADAKDYIDMGEAILKEIDRARSNGSSQMEQAGKFVTVKAGLRNTLDALSYMKDYMMYKKTRSLEGKTETMLYSANPAKQIRIAHTVKELIREREELQQKIINGDVDPGEVQERLGEINAKISEFDGRRLYGSKIGDKLLSINQLKTLSYNPFSAVANVGFGLISASIHANGGQDFSWKELGQAYKLMGHSMLKWGSLGQKDTAQARKMLAIMDRLGIIGDVIDSHYGKVESRERKPGWARAVNPYNWMRSGDYYMKGLTTGAMMLHDKVDVVENGEAKKVSIWEALDDDGQWNKKRFGDNPLWSSDDLTAQKELDKFRNKAVRVNMIIHGNQDKNSPKLANKYILGRLIGQFRMSWLPEGWYSRFEGERYDIQLGRTIKGRYATIKDLGIMGYAAVTLKQLGSIVAKVDPYSGTSRLDGKPLSDVDIANMRRNFSELGFIAGMAGAIILAKSAIDPGDDDKIRWSLRMLANQLIRNQQDLEYYSSPSVIDSLTKSVIPASDVLKDYWKAMKATARVMTDSDYETSQWLLAITHAGLPIPQATLVNKLKTAATKDLDTLQ